MALQMTDAKWVLQSFMIPLAATNANDWADRVRSTASYKFTDTTLGGNFVMNPPAQFTRFADIKHQGRYAANVGPLSKGSKGMGRYYSEVIDDNNQIVHFRFGVPAFTSMTSFFTSFYNPSAGYLASTGRTASVFFNIGKAAGSVVSLIAWPVILAGKAWNFFLDKPNSKYYYLKPAMLLYWNAVNTICNSIAANMGVVPRVHIPGTVRMPTDNQLTEADMSRFHNLLPDVYRESGGIDIYSVANRAQRLADVNQAKLTEVLEAENQEGGWFNSIGPNQTLRKNLQRFIEDRSLKDPTSRPVSGGKIDSSAITDITSFNIFKTENNLPENSNGKFSLAAQTATNQNNVLKGIDAYIDLWTKSQYGKANTGPESDKGEDASFWSFLSDYGELAKAEARDGSQFVGFRVDYTGPASESFSSSAKESDLASKVNGISSSARTARFNIADGNFGDNAALGALEKVIGIVKDTGAGIIEGIGMGGLLALSGRGIVDIPKMWDSSSCNLPRMDYTIELRSPYGDKMSRFQNLMVPLAMLIAGAIPLSTGKQSYTSPFLVEVHSKGRVSCRLGLIDSLSVTRGTGNLGWNEDDEFLGLDITLSIMDLSSIMHMPISSGLGILEGAAKTALNAVGNVVSPAAGDAAVNIMDGLSPSTYDEDNTFTDYMAVLGSLGLADMIYGTNKLKLRATQRLLEFKSWRSKSHFAMYVNGTLPGKIYSAMSMQGGRGNP